MGSDRRMTKGHEETLGVLEVFVILIMIQVSYKGIHMSKLAKLYPLNICICVYYMSVIPE